MQKDKRPEDKQNDHDEISTIEEVLVESLRRFRDLFEQSPIGVGILNTKGDILIVNKSYLEIFGVDAFNKIKEKNIFKSLKLSKDDIKHISTGHVDHKEAEYNFEKLDIESTRKGKGFVLYTIAPLFSDNKITGYMVQLQDITDRKKAETAQRLAHLGQLLSNMAHEVNNPLALISAKVKLAQMKGITDKDVNDTLKVVVEQCEHAKDIMDRLLDYSRVGKLEKGPVNIHKILELITDILQNQFYLSNVVVKKEFNLSNPVIMANGKQLQQVFMNIIRNASDALNGGGVITVRTSKDGGFARIDFIDNGQGMSDEVLRHIFEPFYTTKEKGTGLGLAVCHTIIQEHEGDLIYDSKKGKGTTATILLPTG